MKIVRSAALTAPSAGLLLGFADFVWIKYIPFPFGGLGNSIAVWAAAAFLLTFFCQWDLQYGLFGAIMFLAVAVPSYYVAAAIIQNDSWSNVYSAVALEWVGMAVIAGTIFGAGAVMARAPSRWQPLALALPAAAFIAEIALQLIQLGQPNARIPQSVGYIIVLAALAVGTTMIIARTRQACAHAFAYALPLASFGSLALFTSGFR